MTGTRAVYVETRKEENFLFLGVGAACDRTSVDVHAQQLCQHMMPLQSIPSSAWRRVEGREKRRSALIRVWLKEGAEKMRTLGLPNLLTFHDEVGAQEGIWISDNNNCQYLP